jgi:hypothetical protein
VETVTKWYGEWSGHPKEKMTAKPRKDIARQERGTSTPLGHLIDQNWLHLECI